MTMEVDPEQNQSVDHNQIISFLSDDETICFKSQQRGENDLTKEQKIEIALEIYNRSKLSFLSRFGKYLLKEHLEFFERFTQNGDESVEIEIVLRDFVGGLKRSAEINVRNRRYEALQQMVCENSYFSEIEMMKRNPLLYEQLVGQYLSEEEKAKRDKISVSDDATLVQVLMEGIERDDAKLKRKEQEKDEGDLSEEDEDDTASMASEAVATYSRWGEFDDDQKVQRVQKRNTNRVTKQEQELLKEEFVSSMYEHFLDGKDEDFDYATVDNNDKYDNVDMNEIDEEDKYFDSEEPETVDRSAGEAESEDELDIFMSGLDQNPAVSQLSKDIQRL